MHKKYRNSRKPPTTRTFNLGEHLFVKAEPRIKDKDKYEGPYELIKKYKTVEISYWMKVERKFRETVTRCKDFLNLVMQE